MHRVAGGIVYPFCLGSVWVPWSIAKSFREWRDAPLHLRNESWETEFSKLELLEAFRMTWVNPQRIRISENKPTIDKSVHFLHPLSMLHHHGNNFLDITR